MQALGNAEERNKQKWEQTTNYKTMTIFKLDVLQIGGKGKVLIIG